MTAAPRTRHGLFGLTLRRFTAEHTELTEKLCVLCELCGEHFSPLNYAAKPSAARRFPAFLITHVSKFWRLGFSARHVSMSFARLGM